MSLFIFIIFINLIVFSRYGSSVFLNYNSKITFSMWLIFIYICYIKKSPVFLLFPLLFLITNELLYTFLNIDFFNGPSRTQMFYDMTTTHFINTQKGGTNLTEGIYLKNIKDINSIMTEEESKQLNPIQANNNKYIKLFNDINLSPNDYPNIRILDIGCGNGDFMKYCKSLGIHISGISISENQINELKKQGFDSYLGSYRKLQPQFIGKYDIITCWGSLEHLTNSAACSAKGSIKSKTILSDIMNIFKKYYNPESNYKLLFTSTLHLNRNVCGSLHLYIIERSYGGWYFYDEPNETLGELIQNNGFKQIYGQDLTYHYYMATKIDKNHFGGASDLNLYKIIGMIVGIFMNPQIIAMILYGIRGEWMWQFDGKLHNGELCNDCNFETDRKKRPTTLIWTLNKLM